MIKETFFKKQNCIILLLLLIIVFSTDVLARETVGELVQERTMFSKTTLNDDGTFTLDFSSTPIFYENEAGKLEEIITKLELIEQPKNQISTTTLSTPSDSLNYLNEYDYQVTKNVMKTYFSSKTGKVKIAIGEDWVTMKPIHTQKIQGNKENSKDSMLSFTEIWPGNDLIYTVLGGMIKEDIILKSYDALGEYLFEIQSPSLSIEVCANGDLNFLNENKEVVFSFPAPFMIDNSESPKYGKANYVIVDSVDESTKVQICLDEEWLARKDIQYPIKIDPTASVDYSIDENEREFKIGYPQTINWDCYLAGIVYGDNAYFYIYDPNGKEKVSRVSYDIPYNGSGQIEANTLGTWKVEVSGSSIVTAKGSVTYSIDNTGPTIDIFNINNKDATTTSSKVTLYISAKDGQSGLADSPIRFSNDGKNYSAWESYKTSKIWNLNGSDGTKIVYIEVKDQLGNITTLSDTIKYDSTGPELKYIKINNGDTQTNNKNVTLSISANDSVSGLSQMQFSNGDNYSSWESYTDTKNWILSDGDGYKKVSLQLKDKAGNISTYSTNNILLDMTPPWPNGGINFQANLNLREGTLTTEDSIRDAYENEDKLQYTFSWNKFVDTDKQHTVYSGFKEYVTEMKYKKNNVITSMPTFSQTSSSTTQLVEWNSLYRIRVKGVDNVTNNSDWYPSNTTYFEKYTPAKPTEIKNVYFTDTQLVVDFYLVGNDAHAYKIVWKEKGDTGGEYNNGTNWIIPTNIYATTYHYAVELESYGFKYGTEYQFAIITQNANQEPSVYMPSKLIAKPNRPPYKPLLNYPTEDEQYFTSAKVFFDGLSVGDPDGQMVYLSIEIDKREKDEFNKIYWNTNVKRLNNGSGDIIFDQDGQYRCRLIACDGISTSTTSRQFYIDTTTPKKPVFDLHSANGSESTNQTTISIKLLDYINQYSAYPFPEDYQQINDLEYFQIESNLDDKKRVYKNDLQNNLMSYTLKPINGEHQITVTSYDAAGNSSNNSCTIIFDNQPPEIMVLTDSLSEYFTNNGKQICFDWPDAKDQPTVNGIKNAGIKSYELHYERPEHNIIKTIPIDYSHFEISLNYNEEIHFQVRAKDKVGNLQQNWSNELIWYSKAEPLSIIKEEVVVEEESPGTGNYKQKLKLNITPGRVKYYKVYSFNTTDADNPVQENISDKRINTWEYVYDVNPHQSYKFYLNSFNELENVTDQLNSNQGYSTTLSNNLPTKPIIAVVGGLKEGYLNSNQAEITIKSTDMFSNLFNHSIDYDNDDLIYHFTVKENGNTIINKEGSCFCQVKNIPPY